MSQRLAIKSPDSVPSRLCRAAGLLIIPTCALLHASAGWACTCPPKPSFTEGLATSEIVFKGMVTKVWPVITSDFPPDIGFRYRFVVFEEWKGHLSPKTQLVDYGCAYPFRLGETYVVFARRARAQAPAFSASGCGATLPDAKVGLADLEQLGSSRRVADLQLYRPESVLHLAARRVALAGVAARLLTSARWREMGDSPSGTWRRFGVVILGAGALLVLGFLVWRGRRRLAVLLAASAIVALATALLVWGYSFVLSNHLLIRFAS